MILVSIGQRLAGVYTKAPEFHENQQGASNSTASSCWCSSQLLLKLRIISGKKAAEEIPHIPETFVEPMRNSRRTIVTAQSAGDEKELCAAVKAGSVLGFDALLMAACVFVC